MKNNKKCCGKCAAKNNAPKGIEDHGCKGPCGPSGDQLSLDAILSDILKESGDKVCELTDAVATAAKLFKFMLRLLGKARESYDNVEKVMKNKPYTGGVKLDLSGDRVRVVGDSKTESFPNTHAKYLFDELVRQSRYDFSGIDVRGKRAPELDKNDAVAFVIDLFTRTSDKASSTTTVTHQSAAVYAYLDMQKSIREFDRAIGSLVVPPPYKVACERAPGMCESHCRKQGKEGCALDKSKKAEKKPKDKAEDKEAPKPPTIDTIKQSLLFESKYAIPVKRVKVVADHVDTKSRKWVYELRFFQKDYTKSPIDTQSYEAVPFRIGMIGDTWTKAGRRFDKAVEGLRFNTFRKKA